MNATLPKTNHVSTKWLSDMQKPYALLWESTARRAPSRRVLCLAAVAVSLLLFFSNPGIRYHASEALSSVLGGNSSSGSGSSGSSSTSFKISSSQGICRVEYTVATFGGGRAPVCDPQLCAGRDKLKILQGISHTRRWSAFDESQYMAMFNAQKIAGWLQAPQIQYVKMLSGKQHELGIYGAVGEIGVHHGKFLIPIVGNALVDEPAVAMDLFEHQQANLDKSGYGSKAALLRNLEACGIPESDITLSAGNSMQLSAKNFTSKGWPAFRLLSVDGGHSLEVTLHDLMVASCLVRDGGLVVLDDFPNPTWNGVAEALMHFSHAQDRLVPFLHGYNKVWFATKSHVQQYQELIASEPDVFTCRSTHHESRRTIAGHVLCYSGPYN